MNINLSIKQAFEDSKIRNQTIILGVSGGPDSQAMLKSVPHVAKKFDVDCVAVGINHGLRSEADAELDLAESLANSIGVPFTRIKVNVNKGASVQAQARNARYDALFAEADKRGAKYITTAHHFDDRAETVLIRLIRGKHIGSLGVLPLISGRIFRPMLKVTRKEVLGYCKRWGLNYATDPSNSDTHYLRVKIRQEIMPLFESLNPQFKDRLNQLSDEILNNKISM